MSYTTIERPTLGAPFDGFLVYGPGPNGRQHAIASFRDHGAALKYAAERNKADDQANAPPPPATLYTAVLGKLGRDDARAAYVTGPTSDGGIRPIASFWRYEEAVRYANEHNAKAEAKSERIGR
jgi:hypothetical protein